MNLNKIKLSIIGVGRMGITHYSIINTHPNVQIISVADTSKVTLSILRKYIKTLKVYTDFKELIDLSKPEAIIVCTPPNLHYQIIKYAFERGIHVFCEKPFTANKLQAEELADLFYSSNIINQVGYANRFSDVFNKAKTLIQSRVIGDVIRYKSEMFSCAIVKKTNGDSWRDKKENGGGAVYEMASHLIDLNNYIFGPADSVGGTVLNNVFSANVEDIVSTTLLYKNGLSGTLYVNWSDESYRKPMIIIEIFGTKGKIIADFYGYKIYLTEENKSLNLRKGWSVNTLPKVNNPVPFYVRGNEFTRQLYYFADLVSQKEIKSICTFNDALKTHIIIDKMFIDSEKNLQF